MEHDSEDILAGPNFDFYPNDLLPLSPNDSFFRFDDQPDRFDSSAFFSPSHFSEVSQSVDPVNHEDLVKEVDNMDFSTPFFLCPPNDRPEKHEEVIETKESCVMTSEGEYLIQEKPKKGSVHPFFLTLPRKRKY
jgi:hypothetical protein